MGERYFQLTLAADEAGELVKVMQERDIRGTELEIAERLHARLLEADHEFKSFLYKFKAGSAARPHQHLMQQERELRAMGLLQGQGQRQETKTDEPKAIGIVREEETLLVG